MFSRIRNLITTEPFLTAMSWTARVLATVLAIFLLSEFAPFLDYLKYTPSVVAITLGLIAIPSIFLLYPIIRFNQERNKKPEEENSVQSVVDFSSLSTRQSALHIPGNVPNSLRDAVIWQAELSGNVTKEGVEAAAKNVLTKYFAGIPAPDVANVLAVHESGHATVALVLGRAVVGIKRNNQGGATYSLNSANAPTSEDIWEDMLLTVAGTQAEEMWSPWKTKFPTNGHDDRSDAMGFVTILTFANWTPHPDVNSDIDSLLRYAQSEARRILIENKAMFDDLVSMVLASTVVTAAEILDIAKKHKK